MTSANQGALDAERAVLGILLLYGHADVLDQVHDLRPEDFYLSKHQTIFRSILATYDKMSHTDLILVGMDLEAKRELGHVGGRDALRDLVHNLASWGIHSAAAIGHYAKIVRECAERRRIEESLAHVKQANEQGAPIDELYACLAHVLAGRRPSGPQALGPRDILAAWRGEGPLVHEPTGIAALDEATDGGLVYGTRVVLLGSPDAGKTALAVEIGCTYADRGIAVGFYAVDEEPGDVLQRILQRAGFSRRRCERREHDDIESMATRVESLPIKFYGAESTIEQAAADLAKFARTRGVKAALFVDSLQTVRSATEREGASRHDCVTARMMALRAVAAEFGLIAFATSEMSRAGYRSNDPQERGADLSLGKESGSIEYQARVVLSLRNASDEPDVLELRIVKNKHGLVHREGERGITLRIDRAGQAITQTTDYTPPTSAKRDAAKSAQRTQRTAKDAATVSVVLAHEPGLPLRRLRAAAAKAAGGMGRDRVDFALEHLGAAVVTVPGERRALMHYLVGDRVPADVLAAIPLSDRPAVAAAVPPADRQAGSTVADCGATVAATVGATSSDCARGAPRRGARHGRGGTVDGEHSEGSSIAATVDRASGVDQATGDSR